MDFNSVYLCYNETLKCFVTQSKVSSSTASKTSKKLNKVLVLQCKRSLCTWKQHWKVRVLLRGGYWAEAHVCTCIRPSPPPLETRRNRTSNPTCSRRFPTPAPPRNGREGIVCNERRWRWRGGCEWSNTVVPWAQRCRPRCLRM